MFISANMEKIQSVLVFILVINFVSVNANEENDNWRKYYRL